jgi:hypothetical protein
MSALRMLNGREPFDPFGPFDKRCIDHRVLEGRHQAGHKRTGWATVLGSVVPRATGERRGMEAKRVDGIGLEEALRKFLHLRAPPYP